ncbi:MAG TPA: glycosyltransferase [Allosphingosinicella sp.]|jgi:glycosyltransferase involved in cell wall biosynthesis
MIVSNRLALLLPDFGAGGAERVALRLAKDWLAAGYEVDLVLLRAKGELMDLVPAEVRVVDLGVDRFRKGVGPIVRYLRERRPRAMQISMWPLTVVGLMARALARVETRIVTSDHVVLTRQYGHSRATMAALRATTRLFYPRAEARVIVSEQAADDLARLSGIARDQIDVIYNPVAPPPDDVTTTPEIEALWGDAEGRVINVGGLKDQKNHARLIRSFRAVAARTRAKLMILGEGPLRTQLEALAAELGLADRIVFAGFTRDPWPYYASADLFALSSDYEGYPLVLIEAMRSGLRIVSTDCESGPAEILDRGKYGRLVPVEDEAALAAAIVAALAEPHDPDRLRARAAALSGDRVAERYLELMTG